MAREISLAPTAAVAAAEPAAAPARVRRRRQLHLFSVATDAHEVSAGERRERGGGTSSVSPPMHTRFHDTEKDRETSQVSHDSTNVSSMKPTGTMIAVKILTVLMVLLSFTDFYCLSPRFLNRAFSTCCPPTGVKFIDASFLCQTLYYFDCKIISLQNTILRMFHQEAEEPADDEGAAGKKQGMARDSDEVSPGCRGADGRCSRRWKEARNRALSRKIRHDGEKPVDGARAGGRKRVIARGGERFRGGFAEMRGSRRLASAGRHSHFAAMHAGGG
uniref:Uncharacterized protein n=1 Tax=Oryza rufipogon TaxID=4529 RepID=A0A0E0QT40_ORYRU